MSIVMSTSAASPVAEPPRRHRGARHSHKPALASAAVILTLSVTACAAGDRPATATPNDVGASSSATASASPSPSVPAGAPISVSIGDRSLSLSCTGSGDPTVILEAGLGGDLRSWQSVQPMVASTSRVCSYDRAGIGGSDPAPTPRTAGEAVNDLHALLGAADLEPPYVLVGFSFGGLVTQLFASTYPKETDGLVLVESNHPREIETFESHLTQQQIREDRAQVLDNPEGMDPFKSVKEFEAAGSLPRVPLVVVSAGVSEGWPPGWNPALFDRLWAELQRDLASSIPGGRQVIAKNSRHDVPQQAPNVVAEAVATVVDATRKDRK